MKRTIGFDFFVASTQVVEYNFRSQVSIVAKETQVFECRCDEIKAFSDFNFKTDGLCPQGVLIKISSGVGIAGGIQSEFNRICEVLVKSSDCDGLTGLGVQLITKVIIQDRRTTKSSISLHAIVHFVVKEGKLSDLPELWPCYGPAARQPDVLLVSHIEDNVHGGKDVPFFGKPCTSFSSLHFASQQLLKVLCTNTPDKPEITKLVVEHAVSSIEYRYSEVLVLVIGEFFQDISICTNIIRIEGRLHGLVTVGSNKRVEIGNVITENSASKVPDPYKIGTAQFEGLLVFSAPVHGNNELSASTKAIILQVAVEPAGIIRINLELLRSIYPSGIEGTSEIGLCFPVVGGIAIPLETNT